MTIRNSEPPPWSKRLTPPMDAASSDQQGSATTATSTASRFQMVAPRRGGTGGGVLRWVVLLGVVALCASSLLVTSSSSSIIDHSWMAIRTAADAPWAAQQQQQSTTTTIIDCNATAAAVSAPPPPPVVAVGGGTNYVPVQCRALLQPPLGEDPNRGRLHARATRTSPSFWVSLHNETFDPTRWAIMTYGVYYEKKVAEAFQSILQHEERGRVLDVGGNIGYFTLLSAAMGAPAIDTFEPNDKNRQRLCESLSLNRWFLNEFEAAAGTATTTPRVNLYPYGVGAEAGELTFSEHARNPGQGTFEGLGANSTAAKHTVRVIRLDDLAHERGWMARREDIAILKVDVEGFEHSVFAGATELLQSGIVRNVLMEISVRTAREIQQNRPMLRQILNAGYRLHKTGGWMGPGNDARDMWADGTPTDERVKKINDLATNERAKQLNLWWKI